MRLLIDCIPSLAHVSQECQTSCFLWSAHTNTAGKHTSVTLTLLPTPTQSEAHQYIQTNGNLKRTNTVRKLKQTNSQTLLCQRSEESHTFFKHMIGQRGAWHWTLVRHMYVFIASWCFRFHFFKTHSKFKSAFCSVNLWLNIEVLILMWMFLFKPLPFFSNIQCSMIHKCITYIPNRIDKQDLASIVNGTTEGKTQSWANSFNRQGLAHTHRPLFV